MGGSRNVLILEKSLICNHRQTPLKSRNLLLAEISHIQHWVYLICDYSNSCLHRTFLSSWILPIISGFNSGDLTHFPDLPRKIPKCRGSRLPPDETFGMAAKFCYQCVWQVCQELNALKLDAEMHHHITAFDSSSCNEVVFTLTSPLDADARITKILCLVWRLFWQGEDEDK